MRRKSPRRRGGDRRGPLILFALIVLIAAAIGSFLVAALHGRSNLPAAAAATPASRVVVFVIDGASPADLHARSLPNISGLETRGVTYSNAWVGQLESVPVASSATLGTGVWPRRNGVVGQEWRDPSTGSLARPADLTQVQQGALDQVMESSGAPSLAATIKARNPRAAVLSVGGEGCGPANAAGTWLADFVICPVRRHNIWIPYAVTGHAPPSPVLAGPGLRVRAARPPGLGAAVEGWTPGAEDDWIARETVRAIRVTRPRLTFVNFPEYGALARYVPSSRARLLRVVMKGIDRDIGSIVTELARERLGAKTVYVLTSDGAVARVTHVVKPTNLVNNIIAAGGQPVYLQAGNATVVGLRDLLQAQPVAQSIQGAGIGNVDAIYFKSQTGKRFLYEPQYMKAQLSARTISATSYLLSTMASATSPDLVVLYAPHTGTTGARLGRFRNVGSSLGAQWGEQHIPLVVAGHGLYQAKVSSYPARLVDIAPTIAAVLGDHFGDGDGLVLADALIHPPTGTTARQGTEGRILEALVGALKARSGQ